MVNKDKAFIWSDNWWIENDNVWFVGGMSNILFHINLNTGECDEAIDIPDPDTCKFRLTPICLKYGKDVFCIPGSGRCIWVYNLDSKDFTRIGIDKPECLQLRIQVWIRGNVLFVVSENWNKIMEVSISQKQIINYYTICEKDSVQQSVIVDDFIYMVSSDLGKIYRFDLCTKTTDVYELPFGEKKLFTICFDGKKFWLSGYQKELYIWDKENNSLVTVNSFPQNFGVYDFSKKTDGVVDCGTSSYEFSAFLYSVMVGKYIWLIPRQTNKIIYIDKGNYVLSAFEIPEEDETRESILRRGKYGFGFKYLLEYVRDDRYIGLFSVKNNRILEIDAKELKYQWKDYCFTDECLQQCDKIFQGVYYEGYDVLFDHIYRKELLAAYHKHNSINTDSIGMEIYGRLVKEREIQ